VFLTYAIVGSLVIMTSAFLGRQDKYQNTCVAAGLFIFCIAPLVPSELLSLAEGSRNYDWLLYRADRSLGLDAQAFAAYCYATPWARSLLTVVYCSLPLVFALAWLLSGRPTCMLRAVVFSALAAFVIYAVVPACGPGHVFAGYPFTTPQMSRYSLIPATARNAFPSLHLCWALLIQMNARGRWLRVLLILFVILTGFATVGGGEHYFVDLVAAVPLVAAVQAIVERRK
jgi:hypothetical protein